MSPQLVPLAPNLFDCYDGDGAETGQGPRQPTGASVVALDVGQRGRETLSGRPRHCYAGAA